MLERKYQIDGMCCENCITHVKGALEAVPEITNIKVQIESPQAVIQLKKELSEDKILKIIDNAGHYTASSLNN